jgi:hypothetical protein
MVDRLAGGNMTEPEADAESTGAYCGAERAGPPLGSGTYWAVAAAGRQNASANSVNNAFNMGIIDLSAFAFIGSSAILGPFSFGRQIFKWRDKSYY